MLDRVSRPFVRFVERYYPDPLIFALGLTFLAFLLAVLLTGSSFIDTVIAWGKGFSTLMTFIGQLSLTLVASTALAHTRPVKRALQGLAGLPNTEFACYALATFIGATASWFSWALGLAVGGIVVRHVQFRGQEKGLKLHYPLLVAAAYSGFVIWHMGYLGSAQLFVATKGHTFEQMIGIIPVSQTLFAGYNLTALLLCVVTLPVSLGLMHPKSREMVEFSETVMDEIRAELEPQNISPPATLAEKVERMR